MKIAIPTESGGEEDYVMEHFGRAPTFTVYDSETGEVSVIKNTSDHMGGSGKPPELLASNGIDVVVCSNLGPKAVMMFEQLGIKVYRYPGSSKVKDLIKMLKEGQLSEADLDSACQEHRH
ncbi:MAG: NifB/NifX family molybdenum-iron cluster-binding protein [Archaeoglobaceae archaeon]